MKKDINRYDINGTTATLRYAHGGDFFYGDFVKAAESSGVDLTKKSIAGKKLAFFFNYQADTALPIDSTVLHAAVSSCAIKTLRYALAKDVIDVNALDGNGRTALDKAFQKQRENMTRIFNSIGSRVKMTPGKVSSNIRRARKNTKILNIVDALTHAGGTLNMMQDLPMLNLDDTPKPIQHKKIKAILYADTPRQRLLTIM
tara:strand:+ start:57072 stop:57674 length:603 start_codon:yes stop_codon:yes gene_type:complete